MLSFCFQKKSFGGYEKLCNIKEAHLEGNIEAYKRHIWRILYGSGIH